MSTVNDVLGTFDAFEYVQGRTALEAAMYWKKQEVANILLDHQVTLMA